MKKDVYGVFCKGYGFFHNNIILYQQLNCNSEPLVGLIAVLYSTGFTGLTGFIAFSVSPGMRDPDGGMSAALLQADETEK